MICHARANAIAGVQADCSRTLLLANFAHLGVVGCSGARTRSAGARPFPRRHEPVLARFLLTPTVAMDEIRYAGRGDLRHFRSTMGDRHFQHSRPVCRNRIRRQARGLPPPHQCDSRRSLIRGAPGFRIGRHAAARAGLSDPDDAEAALLAGAHPPRSVQPRYPVVDRRSRAGAEPPVGASHHACLAAAISRISAS